VYDARLLGLWRSDAKRTWREVAARRDIPTRNANTLRRLFGTLELRYTRTRCYATLQGHTDVFPYTVAAKDSSSVAIVSCDPIAGQVISHLHYEGSYMWVSVGTGQFREFLKRARRSTRAAKKRR